MVQALLAASSVLHGFINPARYGTQMDSNDAKYVQLYVNAENQAPITCPKCQNTKSVDVTRYKALHKPLKIKCLCGWVFRAVVETRKFYRKSVSLPGYYSRRKNQNYSAMVVENLSMSGIGFRIKMKHYIKVGDELTIRVILDNRSQTEVVKDVVVKIVVRQIEDSYIGGEFCNKETFYKELGWYLYPS